MSVAPRLFDQVRPLLRGRLVSGDALYCQKALCRPLREAGADYLLAVKANQPTLRAKACLVAGSLFGSGSLQPGYSAC